MKKIIFLLAMFIGVNAYADTTLVWDKKPLDIVLPTDKQVYISFPTTVSFGMQSQYSKILDIQNNNNTLYLKANADFETHQFKVRADDKIILINLSASKEASVDPINVIFKEEPKTETKNPFKTANKVSMQDLIRYAVQQYYAPKRLLVDNRNISHSKQYSGTKYNLFGDGSVTAIALDSYSTKDLTVTALYIKNNKNVDVDLIDEGTGKPIDICGTWAGSILFPQSKLTPAGSKYDSTMLFLLSHGDFISTYKGTCGLGD